MGAILKFCNATERIARMVLGIFHFVSTILSHLVAHETNDAAYPLKTGGAGVCKPLPPIAVPSGSRRRGARPRR